MAIYSEYQLRIRRIEEVDPHEERSYTLPQGETLIGFDPVCDIFLNDRTVSRRHARVRYTRDGFMLTALKSSNGTLLNGDLLQPETEWRLEANDKIQIGEFLLTFEARRKEGQQQAEAVAVTPAERVDVRLSPYWGDRPPGLSWYSLSLLQYLPTIYQPEERIPAAWDEVAALSDDSPATFLARFLALFESVLLPIEWLIENFDFYLNVATTPVEFFSWLESWYGLPLVPKLNEEQRRKLLLHAHELYNLKGSNRALVQVIQLCTDCTHSIKIVPVSGVQFRVEIKTQPGKQVDEALIRQLIVAFKPVYTSYQLTISEA